MAKSSHRLGVIGLGHAARALLPRLANDPRFDLISCWDPSDAAINAAREILPDLRAAFDVEEVFRYADVVYLASPPSTHLPYLRMALEKKRRLVCELPLSVELPPAQALGAELEAQAEAAANEDPPRQEPQLLAFNAPQLLAPAVQLIHDMMRQPRFGKLLTADIQLAYGQWPREQQKGASWLLKRGEGGVTREIGSQLLFVLRRLLGPLEIENCRIGYPADSRFAETMIEARMSAGETPVLLAAQVGGKVAEFNEISFQAKTEGFRLQNWFELSRFRNGVWQGADFGAGLMVDKVYAALLDELDLFFSGKPHRLGTYQEALDVQTCVETLLSTAEVAPPPKK